MQRHAIYRCNCVCWKDDEENYKSSEREQRRQDVCVRRLIGGYWSLIASEQKIEKGADL